MDIPIANVFPLLVKFLPDWIPGAGFKGIARSWKKYIEEVAETPHRFVKQQMVMRSLDSPLLRVHSLQ